MKKKKVDLEEVRKLIADYMWSEGCSCCRNVDKHRANKELLALLLDVPAYSDGSGYDFSLFQSENREWFDDNK